MVFAPLPKKGGDGRDFPLDPSLSEGRDNSGPETSPFDEGSFKLPPLRDSKTRHSKEKEVNQEKVRILLKNN